MIQGLVDMKGAIDAVFGVLGTIAESVEKAQEAFHRVKDKYRARVLIKHLEHLLTLYGNLFMRQSGPVPLGALLVNYADSPSAEAWSQIVSRFEQVSDIADTALALIEGEMDAFVRNPEFPELIRTAQIRKAFFKEVTSLQTPTSTEDLALVRSIGKAYWEQTKKLEHLVRNLAKIVSGDKSEMEKI